MKFSATTLFFAFLGSVLVADELPFMTDKTWLGIYLGWRDRGFDYVFDSEGRGQLFLLEGGERTDSKSYFRVRYILEEKMKKGNWVKRQMVEDGFTYSHEPSVELEESIVTATYTGDSKVAIKHEFERGKVTIRAKLMEIKTENPLRYRIEIAVPDVWKNYEDSKLSEKEVEEKFDNSRKVKDAHLRVVRASDGKRVKFDFWQDIKLMDEDVVGPAGAKEVLIDGDEKFGGRRVTVKTGDFESVPLILENKAELYSGVTLSWISPVENLGKEDNFVSLEVR